MTPATILGVGTAVPPWSFGQDFAADLAAARCCSDERERVWLKGIYRASGVRRRGSVLLASDDDAASIEAFYPPRRSETDFDPTTAARLACYARKSGPLAAEACTSALADAAIEPARITHVVIVSCTGFFSPGLDAYLIERLGLARDSGRVNIGFMGCHGAFNGLSTAAALVQGARDACVLLCCVELCSLHFSYGFDRQRVIANALFADGAAAVVLAPPGHPGAELRDTASLLTRGSPDAMTWRIGDHGFAMGLTAEVPRCIRESMHAWLKPWLAGHSLGVGDIAQWAIHPGGPDIVQAATDSLGLAPEAGDISRAILAEHGNMSSPTVLFILERMRLRKVAGPVVALGFGPGLVFEAALFAQCG